MTPKHAIRKQRHKHLMRHLVAFSRAVSRCTLHATMAIPPNTGTVPNTIAMSDTSNVACKNSSVTPYRQHKTAAATMLKAREAVIPSENTTDGRRSRNGKAPKCKIGCANNHPADCIRLRWSQQLNERGA